MQDFELDIEFKVIASLMNHFGLVIKKQRRILLRVKAIDGADEAQQVANRGQVVQFFRLLQRVRFSQDILVALKHAQETHQGIQFVKSFSIDPHFQTQ